MGRKSRKARRTSRRAARKSKRAARKTSRKAAKVSRKAKRSVRTASRKKNRSTRKSSKKSSRKAKKETRIEKREEKKETKIKEREEGQRTLYTSETGEKVLAPEESMRSLTPEEQKGAVKKGRKKIVQTTAESVLAVGGTAAGMAPAGGAMKTGGKVLSKIGRLFKGRPKTDITTRINVDKVGRQLGYSAEQTAALAKDIGRQRISLTAKYLLTNPNYLKTGRIAMNTKTIAQGTNVLSGSFSKKALAYFGAWATSVFLGRWGHAEAPEALAIPLRDARVQAIQTGDWSIFDESMEAAEELSNPSVWKQIALWSPVAALPGIADKIKGVAEGIELLRKMSDKDKERQLEGTTEEDKWAQRDAEQKEAEERRVQRDIEFKAAEEERIKLQKERDKKFKEEQEGRDTRSRQNAAHYFILSQLKEGVKIEEIDKEIVDLARKSHLFMGKFPRTTQKYEGGSRGGLGFGLFK